MHKAQGEEAESAQSPTADEDWTEGKGVGRQGPAEAWEGGVNEEEEMEVEGGVIRVEWWWTELGTGGTSWMDEQCPPSRGW